MEQSARKPRRFGRALAACLVIAALALPPKPASAQLTCEFPAVPWAVFVFAEALQAVGIVALYGPPGGLAPSLLTAETQIAQAYLAGGDKMVGATTVSVFQLINFLNNIPPVKWLMDGISTLSSAVGLGSLDVSKLATIGLQNVSFTAGGFMFRNGQATMNIGGLGYMDGMMRWRLDDFWVQIHSAMQGFVTQLYGADVNSARLMGSMHDSTDFSLSALVHQAYEILSKKQHVVADETCRFDTVSQSVARGEGMSRGISTAYAQQFNDVGNGKKGTIGANGFAPFSQARFALYKSKYCDPNDNSGQSPCAGAAAGPLAGAATQPSKTIFGKDTIDMSDADQMGAVEQLVYNLTGYQPVPSIPRGALDSSRGRQMMMQNRQYATQMDAVTALIWGVIGDRTPAGQAAAVQAMQTAGGVGDASPTPSLREALRATENKLGNPNYYTNMGETGGTIAQKEVYLRAYNTMLLYKLIEKQEKIANAYAIETANMVQKYKDKGGQRGEVPN